MKRLVIVMAHYNAPDGLERSLASVQEDIPIDVILVDDGSTNTFDESRIRAAFKCGQVLIDYLPENQGVGVAANRGLELAQKEGYEYISRLDCGDICYPGKFKAQLDYLAKNPDVKLLGTWARVVDENGQFRHMLKHPVSYEQIKKKMYLNSMFLNPSVVFSSSVIEKAGNYPYKYRRASQDYAFFFNVIEHYKAENLPEVLMDYVIESHSISTTKRRLQVKNRILVVLEHFYFGWYPIFGLLRGCVLYLFPRRITTFAKQLINKN